MWFFCLFYHFTVVPIIRLTLGSNLNPDDIEEGNFTDWIFYLFNYSVEMYSHAFFSHHSYYELLLLLLEKCMFMRIFWENPFTIFTSTTNQFTQYHENLSWKLLLSILLPFITLFALQVMMSTGNAKVRWFFFWVYYLKSFCPT